MFSKIGQVECYSELFEPRYFPSPTVQAIMRAHNLANGLLNAILTFYHNVDVTLLAEVLGVNEGVVKWVS